MNILNIILLQFYAKNNENDNNSLGVGFLKQNISFAEETMEQVGDGRG